MAVYRLSGGALTPLDEVTFRDAGILERHDLQPLFREHLDILVPGGAMVVAEEFGDWEESRRRIDLLAIDKEARLVVVELKRTQDGGHMELQALRYAAMISSMTFEQAAGALASYLERLGREEDARQALLDFLGWDEEQEEEFAQEVRIILAAADFSKELMTSVLWLNERGLDITCVRIRPYRDRGDSLLLDVQQVLPLPEVSEYVVRVRDKQIRERESRRRQRDYTRFDVTVVGERHTNLPKRRAIYLVVRALVDHGVTPAQIAEAIPWRGRTSLFAEVQGELAGAAFREAAAAARSGRFDPGRWYCDDGDLLYSEGCTYALTNQWGGRTREAIEGLLRAYPSSEVSVVVSQGDG